MKVLIVIDMQNDFVTGALGTPEAQAIIPHIKEKITNLNTETTYDEVIFTKDTHYSNYLNTLEGHFLPVKHCVVNTDGWEIIDELDIPNKVCIHKPSFGYINWTGILSCFDNVTEIELCGVCTDICVVSNALILKALFPEVIIRVDSAACAGTTADAHEAALQVMRSCQIVVY